MFKVNNKNLRVTSMTTFSSVSIADFEQVNVSWKVIVGKLSQLSSRELRICKNLVFKSKNTSALRFF